MKKINAIFILMIFMINITGCIGDKGNDAKSFTIKVICESHEIYQIFYTCYFNGEYYSKGGMADLDGRELTNKTELELVFDSNFFEGKNINEFSMDFSPYGKNDKSEIGTTNRIRIIAEYGKTYTVVFSGDRGSGFTAKLQ